MLGVKKSAGAILLSLIILLSFSGCAETQTIKTKQQSSSQTESFLQSQKNNDEKTISSDQSKVGSELPVTETNIDNHSEIENVIKALSGAGMIGHTWNQVENEEHKYDLSFITFYCVMNPDYPLEIPASTFESFIQCYFDVSTNFLHQTAEYNKDRNIYEVSPDISIDMIKAQNKDFLKIDSILQEKEQIKISYRVIWGDMAESGDGTDTAYAGNVQLKKIENVYHIQSVEVTENHADKYDQ